LKDYVLEQNKGYLEAIRDKNMKILCKNTDTAHAHEDFKAIIQPERLARPVPLVARSCATTRQLFAAFASSTSRLF